MMRPGKLYEVQMLLSYGGELPSYIRPGDVVMFVGRTLEVAKVLRLSHRAEATLHSFLVPNGVIAEWYILDSEVDDERFFRACN